MEEKTPPAQVAAGANHHMCKWSICTSWWKENTTSARCKVRTSTGAVRVPNAAINFNCVEVHHITSTCLYASCIDCCIEHSNGQVHHIINSRHLRLLSAWYLYYDIAYPYQPYYTLYCVYMHLNSKVKNKPEEQLQTMRNSKVKLHQYGFWPIMWFPIFQWQYWSGIYKFSLTLTHLGKYLLLHSMYLVPTLCGPVQPFTFCHREPMRTHSNHLFDSSVNTLRVS